MFGTLKSAVETGYNSLCLLTGEYRLGTASEPYVLELNVLFKKQYEFEALMKKFGSDRPDLTAKKRWDPYAKGLTEEVALLANYAELGRVSPENAIEALTCVNKCLTEGLTHGSHIPALNLNYSDPLTFGCRGLAAIAPEVIITVGKLPASYLEPHYWFF
jgi:hypothetical protein